MTRAPVQVRVTAVLALFSAAAGCGADPVKIATLEEASVPVPCTGWNDGGSTCDGSFCEWTSCGSFESPHSGFCKPFAKESDCPTSESAVCGCDGVTYFNDCFRQADGVSLLSRGPCVFPCGPADPCLKGTCLLLSPIPLVMPELICEAQGGGCWRLPAAAACNPSDAGALVQNACDQSEPCMDVCTALQEGGIYEPCTSP
jgi:hypothetical protein